MAKNWIIVDGYNLIHQEDELAELMGRDIGLARLRLVRLLEGAIPSLAPKVTVVFDGRGLLGGRSSLESTSVEVIFSPAHASADTVIERMVAEAKVTDKILVVTSDHCEADAVCASGAEAVSCPGFLNRLQALRCQTRGQLRPRAVPGRFGRIGDHFPD